MNKRVSQRLLTVLLVVVLISTVLIGCIAINANAANTNLTYEQSKANFYLDYASYDTFMSSEYNMPYRTIVEHNRNNATYKNFINAWQVATFELSDVVDYSTKRKGYYETFLFDILYSDFDVPEVSNTLNKAYKSSQVSLIMQAQKWDEWQLFNNYDISSLTSEQTEKLTKKLQTCDDLNGVFKKISDFGKILKYSSDFEDLVHKLAKCAVISQMGNEYAEVLKRIASTTSSTEMREACQEVANICEGVWDEPTIIMMFGSETVITEIAELFLDKVWDGIIKKCSGYGLAFETGQKVGKFLANLFFQSEKEVENYYEMDALYDFETELKKAVGYYENNYRNNRSTDNAKLFSASYEMLFGVYKLGCDISIAHARIIHDVSEDGMSGLVNLFFTTVSGNREKLNQYYNDLESVKTNLATIRSLANDGVYEAWVNGYCFELSDQYNMPSVTNNYTPANAQIQFATMEYYAFATGDSTIKKSFVLDRDYHTVGDITIENTAIDLCGNEFSVGGDLYLKNCTIDDTSSQGSFIIDGNMYTDFNGVSDITLCSGCDVTVLGDANLSNTYVWSGKSLLIEQGASLTVGKNATISGTSMNAQRFSLTNRGNFIVNGNLQILDYCDFIMDSGSGYTEVRGTYYQKPSNGISAGTIELKGNCSKITASGTSTVKISGDSKQTISSYDIKNLTIENQSEDGAVFNAGIVRGKIKAPSANIVNGKNICLNGGEFDGSKYSGDISIAGNTNLTKSITIEGDLYTIYDGAASIVISGNSNVTVLGNANLSNTYVWGEKTLLIEQGSTLTIGNNMTVSGTSGNSQYFRVTNRGNLIVNGNLQTNGYSSFTMDNDKAYIKVLGTYSNNLSGISAGTIELKGNCTKITASGTNTVIISGDSKQTISSYDVKNMVIKNQSEEGVEFNTGLVRGKIKAQNVKIVNGKNIRLNGGSFDGSTYSGDVSIVGNTNLTSDITIEGDLYTDYDGASSIIIGTGSNVTVLGNANLSNTYVWGEKTLLIEQGATLSVGKNVSITGTGMNAQHFRATNRGNLIVNGNLQTLSYCSFTMDKDSSYLKVLGTYSNSLSGITAGTIELQGNCTKITTSGTNRVMLSGEIVQTISQSSSCPTLIIENDKGIVFNNTINVSTLFNHKGKLFTLYNNGNGSSFVDYDGDGLKDNVDPYPTVGNPCTINVSADNDNYGTVDTNDINTIGGTEVTITASPNEKCYFVNWTDGNGQVLSTKNPYTFIAKTNQNIVAVFSKRSRNITTNIENGYVTMPSYTVEVDSLVTFTVVPSAGYVIEDGSLKYNDTTITDNSFIMPDEDVVISATCVRNENYFNLKDSINNAKTYKKSDYTTESYKNLTDAISDAESYLYNDVSKTDSDYAVGMIEDAINHLEIAENKPTKTYYFINNKNWHEVYAYTWYYEINGSATNSKDWPGEEMNLVGTNDEGYDVYSIDVSSDMDYIIFNMGSSQEQTIDILFDDYEGYNAFMLSDFKQNNHYMVNGSNYNELPFVGHSISLNGDIGVNFYIDVPDEDVNSGKVKVDFAWNVEGTEKTYSVTLSSNDKYDLGYKASCPVPAAEMTYDITATVSIDGIALTNTDTYSVQKYAKAILNDDNNFRTLFIASENKKGRNGEQRYNDLITLVQTMLDYGTKAQVVFDRDTEHPANEGTDYFNDETYPVTSNMIAVTEENMDMDLSAYGLRYKGSTVVYLSETSIRHYYYVDDWDSFNKIKGSVTFDGVSVSYTEKDGAIYFEKKGVSASNLDTPYTLTIKDKSCKFAVNDYIRHCLESTKVSDNTKALVKATYRYNVAANAFFEL